MNVNCKDKYGTTPLCSAAYIGCLEIVKYLVEERHVDVNCKEEDGGTPLHSAAEAGELEVVKYLVEERHVDVNCRDEYCKTPLLVAKNMYSCWDSPELSERKARVAAYLEAHGAKE